MTFTTNTRIRAKSRLAKTTMLSERIVLKVRKRRSYQWSKRKRRSKKMRNNK